MEVGPCPLSLSIRHHCWLPTLSTLQVAASHEELDRSRQQLQHAHHQLERLESVFCTRACLQANNVVGVVSGLGWGERMYWGVFVDAL